MSCIDAAIIAEMNKQKTNDSNSITTKSITCSGKLEANWVKSTGAVNAGAANQNYDEIGIRCYGVMTLQSPSSNDYTHLMTSQNGLFLMGPGMDVCPK